LSGDFSRSNRAYRQPPQQQLTEEARNKLRRKHYRSRLSSFARLLHPLKTIAFTLIIISLCYMAIVQLRHLFFHTSYFEIKTLEVEGNTLLSREHILKTAGLAPGLKLFSIDRDAIKESLLTDPLIKNVDIDLDGLYTLKLKITERQPALYAKAGIAFYEISDDGTIISTEGMGEKNLPVITGLKLQTARAGDSLANNDDFYFAQNWIKSLGDRILRHISEINFSSVQNPYLILISGEKIFPRSVEDFKNRYDFLRALLDNLRKNNVEPFYLDMRAPSEIVVRPKKRTGALQKNRGSVTGE
jgi:cell division protein FtsQ